ncbi:hypothetical protein GCM10027275_56430 [Rhabdobacter roseus]|uniref:Knr4/Smi1-like domain-containing protein n=1 Tax=Rhabdobacter roseus TaxID=1655419 RepID=A0A840U6I8_9BACT|nr:SMI1/KNR4 family protein [Rhabdobacter roseus]MBB5287660.1 hypothetical protein [Rhabdobacter roseus]
MAPIRQLFEGLEEKVQELGIEFNLPATIEEIESLESVVKRQLPQELKDFYGFCNGFETDDTLFRVLPISEILTYKHELTSSWFYLAEYMIYSDDWKVQLLNNGSYVITNDNHGSETPITLTNSIAEFLQRYMTGGGVFGETGLYQWLEEVKNQNKNFT